MRRHRKTTITLIAGLMFLAANGIARAQQDPAATLADTWIVTPKDGHDSQFVEAFRGHLKYRLDKKDPRVWKVYTPVVGDDLNHYVVRTCCTSWSEFDSYQVWSQEAGAFGHWNQNVDQHVAHVRHVIGDIDFANSHWPEDMSGYRYFGVTQFAPKPGHGRQLDAAKKELSDAAKAGNWPRHWSWTTPVGGPPAMMLVTPYKNYAGMAEPEKTFFEVVSEQLGSPDKAAAALAAFTDAINGSTYTVYRLVDEMSMPDR